MIKKLSKERSNEPPIWNRRMLQLYEQSSHKPLRVWCEKIGIKETNVDGYRKGTRSFTQEQIIRAAKLHNTTTDYLLGLTDTRSIPGEKEPLEMIEEGLRILKNKDANQR